LTGSEAITEWKDNSKENTTTMNKSFFMRFLLL